MTTTKVMRSAAGRARTVRIGAVLAVLGLLAACGGGSTTPTASGLSGRWAVDVERTVGAAKPSGAAAEALQARMVQMFAPDAYRLDLATDGRYELQVGAGEGAYVQRGAWTPNAGGVTLRADEANGETLPAEEQQDEVVAQEGAALVLSSDGQRVYLRRVW
jgi:hypothetical protein